MKGSIEASNKYSSAIADGSSIDSVAESGDFVVTAVTKDGYTLPSGYKTFFLIIDYNTANEEIFRIYRRVWTTLYYDKRLSYPNGKKSHTAGSGVQLNDVSELINEVAKNVDNLWFVEEVLGASPKAVKALGGTAHYSATSVPSGGTIADATFAIGATSSTTLTDNATNHVVFDYATGAFVVVQAADLATTNGFSVATVVVAGGAISSITDVRGVHLGSSFLSGYGASNGNVPVFNGTEWEAGTPVDALPNQATHNGDYLTTDGSSLSWGTLSSAPVQTWGVLTFGGTGVQAVTGVGFQPARIEFHASQSTSSWDLAHSMAYVSVANFNWNTNNVYLQYSRSVSASINSEAGEVAELAWARVVHLRYSTVANYVKINTVDADGFTVECNTYASPFKVFYKAYST